MCSIELLLVQLFVARTENRRTNSGHWIQNHIFFSSFGMPTEGNEKGEVAKHTFWLLKHAHIWHFGRWGCLLHYMKKKKTQNLSYKRWHWSPNRLLFFIVFIRRCDEIVKLHHKSCQLVHKPYTLLFAVSMCAMLFAVVVSLFFVVVRSFVHFVLFCACESIKCRLSSQWLWLWPLFEIIFILVAQLCGDK